MRRLLATVAACVFLAAGCVAVSRAGLLLATAPYRAEPARLVMPVDGVHPREVRSSWQAPRPSGRRHEGSDIFAPRGTKVRSATRGTVFRVGWDPLGGRVVTVLGEGPAFYYYAHLDDWADGLDAGDSVAPGEVLGFVGNSGNARTTPPHLHFGVYRIGVLRTRAVDPVPLLARNARLLESPAARVYPVGRTGRDALDAGTPLRRRRDRRRAQRPRGRGPTGEARLQGRRPRAP
ncbi:MAG: M23 family metallopeptidase [Deltaproteobacteria bacterium]|nr:M23 family metallopeptidase [Deltaproteobacteria bacterium]